MTCVTGAVILETYSIVHYNKFGFESHGAYYGNTNHSAFNLNENPDVAHEANGHIN